MPDFNEKEWSKVSDTKAKVKTRTKSRPTSGGSPVQHAGGPSYQERTFNNPPSRSAEVTRGGRENLRQFENTNRRSNFGQRNSFARDEHPPLDPSAVAKMLDTEGRITRGSILSVRTRMTVPHTLVSADGLDTLIEVVPSCDMSSPIKIVIARVIDSDVEQVDSAEPYIIDPEVGVPRHLIPGGNRRPGPQGGNRSFARGRTGEDGPDDESGGVPWSRGAPATGQNFASYTHESKGAEGAVEDIVRRTRVTRGEQQQAYGGYGGGGNRYGGRGGRRGDDFDDLPVDFVIERIKIEDILGKGDETSPTKDDDNKDAKEDKKDAKEDNKKDDDDDEIDASMFVRTQARRKAQEDPRQTMRRKVRGYLNKLSEQNWKKIFDSLKEFPVIFQQTSELDYLVGLILEKATQQPEFFYLYVNILLQCDIVVKKSQKESDKDSKKKKKKKGNDDESGKGDEAINVTKIVSQKASIFFDKLALNEPNIDPDMPALDEQEARSIHKDACKGLASLLANLASVKLVKHFLITSMCVTLSTTLIEDQETSSSLLRENQFEMYLSMFNAHLDVIEAMQNAEQFDNNPEGCPATTGRVLRGMGTSLKPKHVNSVTDKMSSGMAKFKTTKWSEEGICQRLRILLTELSERWETLTKYPLPEQGHYRTK